MVMLQPLAIALRTDRGRRNIMVHSRNIPADDVGRCTAQLMTQLARCVPSSAAGPDLILGIQSACLSQGVFEATGRRYVVTWRMLNEVMIICLVPAGTSILTAHRVSRAVAQLLLLYCKSTTAVTMDRLFKKYVQIHAALGALLRDNGQDHQRAFLDGEGIIGLLKPGAQAQPRAKTLLGLTNKDKQHAATRAGDRALQEVLDEAAHANAQRAAPGQRAQAAASVTLPTQLSAAAAKAAGARGARVRGTTDGFTRPELARAAAAAAAAGEVPKAGGALEGLDDVVGLPGFQMPPEMWPNRLADPEGKLRPPEPGEEVEQEEEEEEEEEVEEEEEEEAEEEEEVQPLPGLGDPSDLMLVEQWHAMFVGQRLEAAATSGHVVCTRAELACYVKIGVPSGCPELARAVERARGHTASFVPEDEAALRKRAELEGGADAAEDTESEYSADLPQSGPALRLAVRAKTLTKGNSIHTSLGLDEGKPPVRSVMEYQLPAAHLPPPFVACLLVHEVPLGEATSMGLPKWDVHMRMRLQASQKLPSPTIHGNLIIYLPESAPHLAACSTKANYVKAKNIISVSIPPMESEGTFDFRAKLSGSSSVSGPGCDHLHAVVRLFSEPMSGTLTGAAVMSGNTTSEMESSKGHYLCNLRLKPLVQRFPLPATAPAEGSTDGKEMAAADAGATAETASDQTPAYPPAVASQPPTNGVDAGAASDANGAVPASGDAPVQAVPVPPPGMPLMAAPDQAAVATVPDLNALI